MAWRSGSLVKPDGMIDVEARLQEIIDSAPPDENALDYAAHRLLCILFAKPASDSVYGLLIALSVVYALIALALGVIFWRRWRKPGWWLFRKHRTVRGSLIVPHSLNVSLLAFLGFALLGQAAIWSLFYVAIETKLAAVKPAVTVSGLIFIFLAVHAWVDIVTLAYSAGQFFQTRHKRNAFVRWTTKPWRFNLLAFGVPLAVGALQLGIFLWILFSALNPGVDIGFQLRATLSALAADGQTFDSSPVALAELQQYGSSIYHFVHLFRIGFAIWLGLAIAIALVWIPLIWLQHRVLSWQLRTLRDTIRALGDGGKAGAIGVSDAAERRVRFLLSVCRYRIVHLVSISIAIGLYIAIASVFVANPASVLHQAELVWFCFVCALASFILCVGPTIFTAIMTDAEATRDTMATFNSEDGTTYTTSSQTMVEVTQSGEGPTSQYSDAQKSPTFYFPIRFDTGSSRPSTAAPSI